MYLLVCVLSALVIRLIVEEEEEEEEEGDSTSACNVACNKSLALCRKE